MSSTAPKLYSTIEDLTLSITQEIHVKAPLEIAFAALLDQIGPYNETPDGKPMPMVLEAWPGGRWFRDLENNNGHFWEMCRRLSGPHCWRSADRSSCPIQRCQTCNTG